MSFEEMFFKKKKKEKNPIFPLLWAGLLLTILGVFVMIIGNLITLEIIYRVGLGFMVLGFLTIFFAFILRRIRKLGIDYFVLGAIIAYIGFIFIAIPIILFAINVKIFENDGWNFALIGTGLFLLLLGFFTETYDLNAKLLKLFTNINIAFKRMLKRVNWKLFYSPYNILSLLGIAIIIYEIFVSFPYLEAVYWYIIGSALIVLNIILLFRKEFALLVSSISKIFVLTFRAIGRGLKHLPRILKSFFIWLWTVTKTVSKASWHFIKYISAHNYFAVLAIGIAIFFIDIGILFESRIALASLLCLMAVMKPLVDYRHELGDKVTTVRANLYKATMYPKRVLTRSYQCPFCHRHIKKDSHQCRFCSSPIPRCHVCHTPVQKKDTIAPCFSCENLFHHNHLKTWVNIKRNCPVCKVVIEDVRKMSFDEAKSIFFVETEKPKEKKEIKTVGDVVRTFKDLYNLRKKKKDE